MGKLHAHVADVNGHVGKVDFHAARMSEQPPRVRYPYLNQVVRGSRDRELARVLRKPSNASVSWTSPTDMCQCRTGENPHAEGAWRGGTDE